MLAWPFGKHTPVPPPVPFFLHPNRNKQTKKGWEARTFEDAKIEISLTIFTCYLCFHVAENEFHASGVLACVFLGLVGAKYSSNVSPSVHHSLHHVWEILSFGSNTIVFLTSGIMIMSVLENESDVFTVEGEDFGYLFALYAIIHVTRAITV